MKTLTDHKWRGYTLDELQARRQINDTRINIRKAELAAEVRALKAGRAAESGVFKKIVNGLSYLDYAVLGISAFKRIASVVSFFRKKK